MKADDRSGRFLQFVDGVSAEFYTGSWDIIPIFEELTPTRSARYASPEEAAGEKDYVALKVTGAIDAPRTGMCAISLGSAGQSQLLIDGKVVTVNLGSPPEMNSVNDAITLAAGRHAIVLIYLSNQNPPRLTLTISEPLPLILDRLHWLYIGCEGDWPKSWCFMSGALAPGRRMPPIVYFLRLDGVEYAPDETAPDRRSRIGWNLAEGDLPSPVSTWKAGAVDVRIQHVAARVCSDAATAVFTRVTLRNSAPSALRPTLCISASPEAEIPLTRPPDQVRDGLMLFEATTTSGESVHFDFVTRACGTATRTQLEEAGGFSANLDQTCAAFRRRTAGLAQPLVLPEPELVAMYRALQFVTQISTVRAANGDWELRGSGNSPGTIVQYDRTFSHDVPNMVEQLIFEGDFATARAVMESDYYQRLGRDLEQDYLDAIPKYLIPYASYLIHTGDVAYFTSERRAQLRLNAHRIHEFRLAQMNPERREQGLYGLLNQSNTMDNGKDYLLVDNLAALHGLAAYRYLAEKLGDSAEAAWVQAELEDLNACLNEALRAGMARRGGQWYHALMAVEQHALLDQPANWLATSFMMAAFPWGAWLKGFDLGGAWKDSFDGSIKRALEVAEKHGCVPGCWGAFWKCKYGSTYNAAAGLNLLYSQQYRALPIANLRWLVENQSAPFQWGENFFPPTAPGDWTTPCTDYETWGLCFSRQVLLQSCIAVHADGSVLIARGVPDEWLKPGDRIAWKDVPLTGGRRLDFELIAEETALTLRLSGDRPEGPVSLQPPLLAGNIGAVAADAEVVSDQAAGSVAIAPAGRRLTVTLRRARLSQASPAREPLKNGRERNIQP
ncbi:MAG: hypothetical protein PCFJNLEI_00658 [Verrucomicrobiae bacterium]|nr:hypothetical protein [Verrucomicrobiae bacterium]